MPIALFSKKCKVVNLTQNVFVLAWEKMKFLERNDVLPAVPRCHLLCVLNHIGTACVSGIQQATEVVSQSLTQVGDGERRQLFRGYVYSNFLIFQEMGQPPPVSGEPSVCLCCECRQPNLFVLSSEEVCGDCLRLFAKGWVCWNTLRRHLTSKHQLRLIWSAMLPTGGALNCAQDFVF